MVGDYGSTGSKKAPTSSMKKHSNSFHHRQAGSMSRSYGHSYEQDEEDDMTTPFLLRSPVLSHKTHRLSISQSSDRSHPRRPSMPAAAASTRSRRQSQIQSEKYNHYRYLSNTGSEPGIDVTQPPARYAKLKDACQVTVVDYSDADGVEATRVDMDGAELQGWLNSEEGRRPGSKDGKEVKGEKKSKSVRWINLDGINFPTIKTLALKYNLHPLAIEDALRAHNNPRSKIDFYADHLYTQVLVQYIRPEDEEEIKGDGDLPIGKDKVERPSSYARSPFREHVHYDGGDDEDDDDVENLDLESRGGKQKSWWRRPFSSSKRKDKAPVLPDGVEGVFEPLNNQGTRHGPVTMMGPAHRGTVDQLSAKYMVPIRRTVFSCFMLRDGTLITMSASPYSGILDPIYMRLEKPDGILRRTADSSMLLEALLDIVVDIAIEISQAFEAEILKIEAGCLIRPEMEAVRHLHVISSQLTRMKRTLGPLARVLYTLRNRDQERALASLLYGARPGGPGGAVESGHEIDHDHGHHSGVGHRTEKIGLGDGGNPMSGETPWHTEDSAGYISRVTKIYLSDVIDHLDTVLGNIDQFIVTTDHLTSFVFNLMSFDSNSSMERLSLVTVIFMPATFMTGYWGMNIEIERFTSMPYDDLGFWYVAIPVLSFFFVVFCHQWIWSTINVGRRLWARRQREEAVFRSRKKQ